MNKKWVIVTSRDGLKFVFDYNALECFSEIERLDQGERIKEVVLHFIGGKMILIGGTIKDFMKQIGVEDAPVLEAV